MSKRRRSSPARVRTTTSSAHSADAGAPAGRPKPRRAAPRRRSRLRTWALPGLIGAVVLTIVALGVFGGGSAVDAAGSATSPRPALGDAAAPVVIREYADFQCPSCGAFARLIEPQIRSAYIDTRKVRLEWHDFAWIGRESRDAANAARCAGDQGRFWEFHDLLYASQAGENQGAFAKDRLRAFGADLGLDAVAFDACVDADTHRGAVEADFADVRANGFNATPTFLVGDQRIVGAQPFEVFAAAIDAQLASE